MESRPHLPPFGPLGGYRTFDLSLSDFVTLRRRGHYYVDRTQFILHVLTASYSSMLIPRPRRFGKTVNMSMLRDFFALPTTPAADADIHRAFENTLIWDTPQAMQHFQQYPVLYFTFKDCKAGTWTEVQQQINDKIFEGLMNHGYLKDSPRIPKTLRAEVRALYRNRRGLEARTATLRILSRALKAHHGRDVVILIDEYDAPILHGLAYNFYERTINFFKAFFGEGFKDNPALFRGVLTGILRVSKENVFSDLNNIGVFSLLNDHFCSDFGFTDEEVVQLCVDQGCPGLVEGLRQTYNGYRFGTEAPVAIYNPFSTLSCVADSWHALKPYWHSTGSPSLLNTLVLKNGASLHTSLKALLEGQSLRETVTEHIELGALGSSKHLFSFMLFGGYLRCSQPVQDALDYHVTLELVNGELRGIFRTLYSDWLTMTLRTSTVEPLTRAVLSGDEGAFEEMLRTILQNSASVMDGAGSRPENFYQGLLLGLLVALRQDYEVASNLEVGTGRADLLLLPKEPQRVGVVMELKVVRKGETVLGRLIEALEQIEQKSYTSRLESLPASPIFAYGVAFDGKVVRVARREALPALRAERDAARAGSSARLSGLRQRSSQPQEPDSLLLHFSAEERLALANLVRPCLDADTLGTLWLQLDWPLEALPQRSIGLLWELVLSRAAREGKLDRLITLLVLTFPNLQHQPLLERLRS